MKSKITENQKNLFKSFLNFISKTKNIIPISVIVIINLFSVLSYSQESKIASIIKYEDFVSNSKSATKAVKPLRIESLINDIQSAVYVEQDGIKSYGIKPVSLFVDAKNINKIKLLNIKKEAIEIATIRINNFDDLKSDIDLTTFSEFNNLKYIYIISDIKCNESDIKPIIKSIGNFIVLYKIANNS